MSSNDNLQLKDKSIIPTVEVLEQALGNSYTAYEALQNTLSSLDMEQEWQWYTPYKAWLAKGQHFWTTKRGTKKEKNLYWLYVYDGYFSVAIWFKEKNRQEVLNANLKDHIKQMIVEAETMGDLPTFPLVLNISKPSDLSDVYDLIHYKKVFEK